MDSAGKVLITWKKHNLLLVLEESLCTYILRRGDRGMPESGKVTSDIQYMYLCGNLPPLR